MRRYRHVRGGLLTVTLLAAGAVLPACGGGGGGSGGGKNNEDLAVVEFALVDQVGRPTGAQDSTNAYRNNRLIFTFSEKVDPTTVDDRTIQIGIPSGTNLFLTAQGRFTTDGNQVLFDPTVTNTNAPNPFGFEANSVYSVTVKGLPEAKTIQSVRGKPVLSPYTTNFTTTDLYLPDLDQPRVLSIEPPADAVDVESSADIVVDFSEAMLPETFDPEVSFRVINLDRGGRDVFGQYRFSDDAKTVVFRPTFGFGRGPYRIQVNLTVDLTDLAGNPIANPQQWVFTTIFDPTAINEGLVEEYFDDNVFEDTAFLPTGAAGKAEWNPAVDPGKLASTFGNTSTTVPNPLQGFNSGNSIPLGTGSWNSSWCQLWYSSSVVGNAGTISGYKWFLYSGSAGQTPTITELSLTIGHSKGSGVPFAPNNARTSHFAGTPVTCINKVTYSTPSAPVGTPLAFPKFTSAFGYDGTSNLICDVSKTSATQLTYWAIASGNSNGARAYAWPRTAPNTLGTTFNYLYQCVIDFRNENSMAQSLWYRTESNDPTFLESIVSPTEQPPGTETAIVYQGAHDDGSGAADPATFTDWTDDVTDLAGYQYVRFQASFTANLATGVGPRIEEVVIPYIFF
jgi:hypothetical protein